MHTPTNRRELRLALDKAYSSYVRWLETECQKMGLEIGVDIGGTNAMEERVGRTVAAERYAQCQSEMTAISAAYGQRIDERIVAREREQEAIDNRLLAIKRAEQEVEFAEDELLRERARANVCVVHGIVSQDEADDIVDAAEEILDDAREELASVRAAFQMPRASRADALARAKLTYAGPMKNSRPKVRPFRRHSGIGDATLEEIRRLYGIGS